MGTIERTVHCGLFDELVYRGAGAMRLVSGDDPMVSIRGPEDLVQRVNVRTRGMKLIVSLRFGPNPMALLEGLSDKLEIIAVTDSVTTVKAQGAGSVILGRGTDHPIASEELKVINSGAGTLRGDVSAGTLKIRIRGVGRVELSGDTQRLDACLSGIGSLDAGELVAQSARVLINSIGSASLMVLDEITATMNGMGSLSYRGPAVLTRRGGNTRGAIDHLD